MSRHAQNKELAIAVIAASCAACVTALVSAFIYVGQFASSLHDLTDPSFYQASLFVGVVAVSVTVVVCPLLFIFFGLPLYWLSVRLRWVQMWQYAIVGFGVSCLAAVAALIAFPLDSNFAVPLATIGGTFATVAFWYVARPDLQAE